MYTDIVLDQDYEELFAGTPEEVREWLTVNPNSGAHRVLVDATGEAILFEDYLKGGR